MSIRELNTFLAIAEAGSFAAAARSIYRTQSAVTAQMQALERRLGVQLFDRTSKPPTLTEAARNFIPRAADVVAEYDRLFRSPDDPELQGYLRLAVVPSVITGLVPQALVMLRRRHPGLHIDLTMGLSGDLVNRVRRNMLDVALISDPLESGMELRWSPFLREPLVLIAPITAGTESAEQLIATYPFIRYTQRAWVGQLIEQFIKRQRFRVHETMMLDSLEAIVAMVHAGLGVSIVPVPRIEPPGALPVRRVTLPGTAIYRTLGLVEVPDHPKAALSLILLSGLRDLVGQTDPVTSLAPSMAATRRSRPKVQKR